MKAIATTSAALGNGDRRLDASFHASEGIKALQFIRHWKDKPSPLSTLGMGIREANRVNGQRYIDKLVDVCQPDGIFIGGRARRIYVSTLDHGIPFLSSSDMLMASFDGVKLISKKQPDLDSMILQRRWTLISRSGTIGNVVYARPDMQGLAGSEHVMRVVPNSARICPGYVYAFLSSPLGQAILRSGTFGSVVDTISPGFVGTIPIPRLDPALEERIHGHIEQAAELRGKANELLERSKRRFQQEVLGLKSDLQNWQYTNEHSFAIDVSHLHSLRHRLDAFHYIGYAAEAQRLLGARSLLGELVEPYQPPIFKRPYTGNSGIPFMSGIDLYNIHPSPHMFISRQMATLGLYCVDAGMILVQRVGQRYGLFGRPVILPQHLHGAAVSEHLFRLRLRNAQDRGFVYIWLSTEVGRRLLLKQSYGTSMGVLDEQCFAKMPVPAVDSILRASFEHDLVVVFAARDEAIALENQAQTLLIAALK